MVTSVGDERECTTIGNVYRGSVSYGSSTRYSTVHYHSFPKSVDDFRGGVTMYNNYVIIITPQETVDNMTTVAKHGIRFFKE